jgi:hypothetical protein
VSRLAPARFVGLSILVECEQAEDVDVLARKMAIPVPCSAARDDDQPALPELVRAQHLIEKRNPVEQLEANLADPRPDDDWCVRLLESLELPSHGIDSIGCRNAIELLFEERRDHSIAHDRDLAHRVQEHHARTPDCLEPEVCNTTAQLRYGFRHASAALNSLRCAMIQFTIP